jgi:hypothetical protein
VLNSALRAMWLRTRLCGSEQPLCLAELWVPSAREVRRHDPCRQRGPILLNGSHAGVALSMGLGYNAGGEAYAVPGSRGQPLRREVSQRILVATVQKRRERTGVRTEKGYAPVETTAVSVAASTLAGTRRTLDVKGLFCRIATLARNVVVGVWLPQ